MKGLKNKLKKAGMLLLICCFIAAFMPTAYMAYADPGTINIIGGSLVITPDGDHSKITGNGSELSGTTIVISGGSVTLTIDNINLKPTNGCPIKLINGANVNLVLSGTNILDSTSNSAPQPGLEVDSDCTLTISGTGSLTAKGYFDSAGIGGITNCSNGTININSGSVTAIGGNRGAGIGSGLGTGSNISGTINISGGNVTADGTNGGAGIGGGSFSNCGIINISGGTVIASGGANGGAGIGGGHWGGGGSVTITGSNTHVTVAGNNGGNDIGSGSGNFNEGTIKVGNTNATSNFPEVTFNGNGTDASATYLNCKISGPGAGALIGTYYAIAYVSNGGSIIDPHSARTGDNVSSLPQPTRNGYDFAGWYVDSNFNGSAVNSLIMASTPITLYAKWTPNNYSISYNLGGISADNSANTTTSYVYNASSVPLQNLSASGYTFGGWYTNSGFTGSPVAFIDDSLVNGHHSGDTITLYAMWIPVIHAFVPVTNITGVPSGAVSGTPLTLTGTVNPSTATNRSITWSVRDQGSTGAVVSGNTLTTTGAGTAVVTADIINGSSSTTDYKHDFTITVTSPSPIIPIPTPVQPTPSNHDRDNRPSYTTPVIINQTGFSFPSGNVTKSVGDAPFKLPTLGGQGTGTVTYSSSNPGVANIDSSGFITLHGAGTAIITAVKAGDTGYYPATASVTVTVNLGSQTGFSFPKQEVNTTIGSEPFTIAASGGQSAGAVTYTSSNNDIASVDNLGKVTLHKTGTAVITASKAGDGMYSPTSASITVTVASTTASVQIFPIPSAASVLGRLSSVKLEAGMANVPGSFTWKTPNTVLNKSGFYDAVFTPQNSTSYSPVYLKVFVTVNPVYSPSKGVTLDLSHAAASKIASVSFTAPSSKQKATISTKVRKLHKGSYKAISILSLQVYDEHSAALSRLDGSIAVKLPVSSGARSSKVFYYESSSGKLTDTKASYSGGSLKFNASKPGFFVIMR